MTILRRPTCGPPYALVLADGSHWEILACDEEAASLVSQFAGAMRLQAADNAVEPVPHARPNRLYVHMHAAASPGDGYVPLASRNDGSVVCALSPCAGWGGPYANLLRLSLIMARESQFRGGALIHGALVEKDGRGMILAAPGGTGKTTASRRFPAPWSSLSDDTALVVRDPRGCYWAHAWPTWSRFLDEGPGGAWDVQSAVRLAGLFFLARAAGDRTEPIGPGQAVSLLGESVGQASAFMEPGLSRDELRDLRLERFNSLCAMTRVIPAYWLHISLTGAFWREIERAFEGAPGEQRRKTPRVHDAREAGSVRT
jgi:SynChlorMet cassette protein ScmC